MRFLNLFVFCFFSLCPQVTYSEGHQPFLLSPLKKADSLFLSGNYNAAILAYKDLVLDNKFRRYAIRGLVKAYSKEKRIKELIEFLNQELTKVSNPSDFLYGLGYLYYLEEEFDDAEMFLREAVKLNHQNDLARNNLAALLSETRRNDEALKQVKEALASNPKELMFFQNLFLIYKNMGKVKKFKIEFSDYITSGNKELAFGYGMILARNLRQKGFQLYSKGQRGMAVNKFEKMVGIYHSIDHFPGLIATWFSLGLLYEEQGIKEKSIEYYEKILSVNPNHIQAKERLRKLENFSKKADPY